MNCTHSFWSIGKKPHSVSCSRSTFAVRWRHGLGSGSIVKVLMMSDGEDRCLEAQGLGLWECGRGQLGMTELTGVGHLVLTVQTSLLRPTVSQAELLTSLLACGEELTRQTRCGQVMTSIDLATATPSWRDSQDLLVLTKWVWGELTFVGSLGVEFSLNGLE